MPADLERHQRYDLVAPIASGGMGEVFLAQASGAHGFRKTVAVKRIRPDLAGDPEWGVRFVAEAKLAVSLGHANIVHVFDLGRSGDDLFLVMEYVQGADLAKVIGAAAARAQRPSVGTTVHVAIEALKGLMYAHERLDLNGHPS